MVIMPRTGWSACSVTAGRLRPNQVVIITEMRTWTGHPEVSHDSVVKRGARGEGFADLVKNTYRVLLTRGMKGCYVYVANKDTERFFRSRMEA